MEEQTIPSDAPSEYMRGYSDGVEWARQDAQATIERMNREIDRLNDEAFTLKSELYGWQNT